MTESAVLHNLTGASKMGVTVRCGVKVKIGETTAWGSEVTCPDCLTNTVVDAGPDPSPPVKKKRTPKKKASQVVSALDPTLDLG